MEVYILPSEKAVSQLAADCIEELIREKPRAVLGLATGSTSIGIYRELILRYKTGSLDFSQVTTFNLDEYYGLAVNHPQSYHSFMYKHLFQHINLNPSAIHIPESHPADVEVHCQAYEQKIAEKGIDLQLLGIGQNGHIGFNEPATILQESCHLVQLSKETIAANARFFEKPEDVPQRAITMGMRSIFQSKHILLLATGERKAEIIAKLFEPGIRTDIPATLLKLHQRVTIIMDEDAAQLIKKS